jgi:hypothetical protein
MQHGERAAAVFAEYRGKRSCGARAAAYRMHQRAPQAIRMCAFRRRQRKNVHFVSAGNAAE